MVGVVRSSSNISAPFDHWEDPLGAPLLSPTLAHSLPPPGTTFRDPCVFQDPTSGNWYIISGVFNYYIAELGSNMYTLTETPKYVTVDPNGHDAWGPYGKKTDDKPYLHFHDGKVHLRLSLIFGHTWKPFANPASGGVKYCFTASYRVVYRHVFLNRTVLFVVGMLLCHQQYIRLRYVAVEKLNGLSLDPFKFVAAFAFEFRTLLLSRKCDQSWRSWSGFSDARWSDSTLVCSARPSGSTRKLSASPQQVQLLKAIQYFTQRHYYLTKKKCFTMLCPGTVRLNERTHVQFYVSISGDGTLQQAYFSANDRSHYNGTVSNGAAFFRNSVLGYVHYRPNGTISPIVIDAQGVNSHNATSGSVIQAEHFQVIEWSQKQTREFLSNDVISNSSFPTFVMCWTKWLLCSPPYRTRSPRDQGVARRRRTLPHTKWSSR